MFRVFPIAYLAELLEISESEFHRDVKPVILNDFKLELRDRNIRNPNIGLDNNKDMYLVNTSDLNDYIETHTNITVYLNE